MTRDDQEETRQKLGDNGLILSSASRRWNRHCSRGCIGTIDDTIGRARGQQKKTNRSGRAAGLWKGGNRENIPTSY